MIRGGEGITLEGERKKKKLRYTCKGKRGEGRKDASDVISTNRRKRSQSMAERQDWR